MRRLSVHRQLQHRGWRCLQDCAMIEVKCDDFPAEMGWIPRDRAGTLAAGQSIL
jgi:hypothetical protein